jgi:DNA-binding PadR family transcriptional regulator
VSESRATPGVQSAAMKSVINWALLGIVVARPGYALELAERFEHTYRGALSLSGTFHVYAALGALTSRSLIEEVPGAQSGSQPKPHYRATAIGIARYGEWFVDQVREERERERLIVLQLAALVRHPQAAGEIFERYEQAWLEQEQEAFMPSERSEYDENEDWLAELLSEENRLVTAAKVLWVAHARSRLEDLARTPPGR